jgi:hypothetical protein
MRDAAAIQRIELRFRAVDSLMDERMRRHWAAAEAATYGWGGACAVAQATGLSRTTIRKGAAELQARKRRAGGVVSTRLRRAGGGRKRKTDSDPGMLAALEALLDPATRGDP